MCEGARVVGRGRVRSGEDQFRLTTRSHPILAAGSFPLTGGAFYWASANYSDCLVRFVNGVVCNKGFRDASQQEREVYEDPDWARRMAELWSKLSPLYQQLHTYVRRRLHEYYGPRRIRLDGPLPAHVLGTYSSTFHLTVLFRFSVFLKVTNLKGQI